jgi:hypothetical protein
MWRTIRNYATSGFARFARLLAMMFLGLAAASPALALTASFTSKSISITGVSPSARILVCGYGSRTALSGVESWSRQAAIVRSTASGTADVPIEKPPLDLDSIWLIVDLSTGEHLVTPAPGGHPRQMVASPLVATDLRGIAFLRPGIDAIIVRVPLGAWIASAVDGRTSDLDGRNDGRATLGLNALTPIGDTPHGPAVLVPGDLVLAIYQPWMEYAVVQIPAGGSVAH